MEIYSLIHFPPSVATKRATLACSSHTEKYMIYSAQSNYTFKNIPMKFHYNRRTEGVNNRKWTFKYWLKFSL
jgi:hypothetical protein